MKKTLVWLAGMALVCACGPNIGGRNGAFADWDGRGFPSHSTSSGGAWRITDGVLTSVPPEHLTFTILDAGAFKRMREEVAGLFAIHGRLLTVAEADREIQMDDAACHGMGAQFTGESNQLSITNGSSFTEEFVLRVLTSMWSPTFKDGSAITCYLRGGGDLTLAKVQESLRGIIQVEAQ